MVHTMIVVGALAIIVVLGFVVYNALSLERENQWLWTEKDRLLGEINGLNYELHATEERAIDRPNREPFDQYAEPSAAGRDINNW